MSAREINDMQTWYFILLRQDIFKTLLSSRSYFLLLVEGKNPLNKWLEQVAFRSS